MLRLKSSIPLDKDIQSEQVSQESFRELLWLNYNQVNIQFLVERILVAME